MGRRRDLPDDIIRKIITDHLLRDPTFTNKTAVRLSLVSKEFLSAVKRRPALGFSWHDLPIFQNRCMQEFNHLLSTLIRYDKESIHLDTFQFRFNPDYSGSDRCIELATSKNLGLKNLHIWVLQSPVRHVLPQPVFEVESLVQLDLRWCRLQPAERITMWPNLKTLCLHFVNMVEGVFENIIRGCPLIEILEIRLCCMETSNFNFKASNNLNHLKQLDIWLNEGQNFELGRGAASNLERLACFYSDFYEVGLGKHEFCKLKSLSLSYLMSDVDSLINLARQFPVLEELFIDYSYRDKERISISHPSLKKIRLHMKGLQEASFDVPNIILFEFDSNVVPKLSFAGNSGGCMKSLMTFKIRNADIDTAWCRKLKEFLSAITLNKPAETSIHVSFGYGFMHLDIKAQAQKSADSVSFPGIITCAKPRTLEEENAVAQLEYYWSVTFPEQSAITRRILICQRLQRVKRWMVNQTNYGCVGLFGL